MSSSPPSSQPPLDLPPTDPPSSQLAPSLHSEETPPLTPDLTPTLTPTLYPALNPTLTPTVDLDPSAIHPTYDSEETSLPPLASSRSISPDLVGSSNPEIYSTPTHFPPENDQNYSLYPTLDSIDVPNVSLGTAHTLDFDQDPSFPLSSSLSLPPIFKPGQYFGDFEILNEIGHGGMGAVYAAYNHTLKRRVALKVIFDQSKQAKRGLVREAQSIAQLDHPHIVNVYRIGEHENWVFIEMQLIEGQSLRSLIANQTISLRRGLKILLEVATALHHAHQKGVIHRDIKVENVLVSDENRSILVDFGLARNTSETLHSINQKVSGTPVYMAPEVWLGEKTDFATDLYAFGVMSYFLFTRTFPCEGDHWNELLEAHESKDRNELKTHLHFLPADLQDLIIQCIQPKKEDRLDSTQTLVNELERIHYEVTLKEDEDDFQRNRNVQSESQKSKWKISRSIQKQALAIALVCFLGIYSQLWNSFDLLLLDFLQISQPSSVSHPVGLIKLDELKPEDYKHLTQDSLAEVGERLINQGVLGIGVDLIESYQMQTEEHDYWAELSESPIMIHNVVPFKDGIESSKTLKPFNRLKTLLQSPRQSTPPPSTSTIEKKHPPFSLPLDPIVTDSFLQDQLQNEPNLIFPYPNLLEESQHLGHLVLSLGDDGITRSIPLFIRHQDRLYPALSLLLACQTLGVDTKTIRYIPGSIILPLPNQESIQIPVDDHGRLIVRIRGEAQDRSAWSFLDLHQMSDTELKEAVPLKTMLIGSTTKWGGDFGPLGFWRHIPMVYAHLLATENILNQDFIYLPSLFASTLLALFLSLLCFGICIRFETRLSLGIIASLNCAIYLLALLLLIATGYIVPLGSLLILVSITGLWAIAYKGYQDRKNRIALNQRLGELLPSRFMHRLLYEQDYQEREAIKSVRIESVVIALRFFDLDQMSDTLSPQMFASALNETSRLIRKVALDQGGMVCQAHRECVLITFHPNRLKENPLFPYLCALNLESQLKLQTWHWKEIGQRPTFGITLHKTPLVMGPLSLNQEILMSVCGGGVRLVENLSMYSKNTLILSENAFNFLTHSLQLENEDIQQVGQEGPSCRIEDEVYKTSYLITTQSQLLKLSKST